MRPFGIVSVLCLILAVHAAAQEPVTLKYKFAPGTEITITKTGAIKTTGQWASTGESSATTKAFVLETDPATGAALVGAHENTRSEYKMQSAIMESVNRSIQRSVRVARVMPSGEISTTDKEAQILSGPQIGSAEFCAQCPISLITLSENAVAEGATWKTSVVDSGYRQRLPCICKLESIAAADGRRYAKITWLPDPEGAQQNQYQEVTCSGSMDFDIEAGLPTKWDVTFSMTQRYGPEPVTSTQETHATLGARTLTPDQMAPGAAVIRQVASILDHMSKQETDAARAELTALKAANLPEEWKAAPALLDQVVQESAQNARDTTSAIEGEVDSLAEASKLAEAGSWKEAVVAYRQFAEKNPLDDFASGALATAMAISRDELNDPAGAKELAGLRVVLHEKEAAVPAAAQIAQYKLASAYADAGENQKALEAYGKFLATPAEPETATLQILAYLRTGKLLEGMKRPAEALAAYRIAEQVAATGDHAAKLKEQARANAAALEQPIH